MYLSKQKGHLKMDITDTNFETWFDCLHMNLLDAGINFTDRSSVREDYEAGKNMFDVVDEIILEYAE